MTPKPDATFADLDALPPGTIGEIIEGVLYTMTKPRAPHQYAVGGVFGDLRVLLDRGRKWPGGWWILAEPGIELPENTKEISPDVAGWRRERLPRLPRTEPIRVVTLPSMHCTTCVCRAGWRAVTTPLRSQGKFLVSGA